MSKKEETAWTNKICEHLRKERREVRPLEGTGTAQSSWPDRLMVLQGAMYLVEFKGPETRIDPDQLVKLKRLHNLCPGRVMICRKRPTCNGGIFQHPVLKIPLGEFDKISDFESALVAAGEKILANDVLRRPQESVLL